MIDKNSVAISTYCDARYACKEIFSVACRELYDPELNHLYTREYREKAVEVCKKASASYVNKVYDCHLHDHYNVEVPEDIIDDLMEQAVYENDSIKIGNITRKVN